MDLSTAANTPSTRWRISPLDRPPRWPTYEAAVVAILVVWNLLANLVVPDRGALPLSLIAITAILAVARASGAGWSQLGWRRDTMAGGIAVGTVVMATVAAAIVVLALTPPGRELLADERFSGVSTLEMLYEVFVRIPLATAFAEEMAFRGVLLGLLLLWMSPLRAVVLSSALFGLWHILPGLDALDTSAAADLASGWAATVAEVGVQVLVTGLAGAGFAWLRLRTSNVAAPVLAHWGFNGAAYLTGWLIVRNAWA